MAKVKLMILLALGVALMSPKLNFYTIDHAIFGGQSKKTESVITTDKDWKALWDNLHPKVDLPKIDFNLYGV